MTDISFSGFGYWREMDSDGNAVGTVPNNNRVYKATGVFRLRPQDELHLKYFDKKDLELLVLWPSDHKDDCFEKDIFGLNRERSEFIIDESKTHIWEFVKDQPIESNHSDNQPNQITETERNTLLKLVLGMAIDAYGYDPEAGKNPATGDKKNSITTRLSMHNIKIDSDTVRKYLTEAKKLL